MGEYLKYIIIGAFLLIRFILANKKKQDIANTTTSPKKNRRPQASTTSLDDILRELTGETVKQKKAPKPAVAKPKQSEKIVIEDHQYDFRPEYEHHADLDGPSLEEIRSDIAKDQRLEVEHTDLENFNLRQAIIAQTILTRPEY